MPDSVVLGTIGHAKRRAAKARRRGYGYDVADVIPTLAGGVALVFMIATVLVGYLIVT